MELLSGLSGLVKVKNCADIDSAVFKLHYRLTATLLFGFCLLVTANSLVGDPIRYRSSVSRCGASHTFRQPHVSRLLSVGALCTLSSGSDVLRTALVMEDVGGR